MSIAILATLREVLDLRRWLSGMNGDAGDHALDDESGGDGTTPVAVAEEVQRWVVDRTWMATSSQ